jgi:hypothetical protein
MTFKDFADQIIAVGDAIHDQLDEHPLTKELRHPPKDWRALRESVRSVAEDLILCADVDEAIAQLRQDQSRALNVIWLTNLAISEDDSLLAMKRAYEDTRHVPTILPLHAFCAYLIELCEGLELKRKT